MSDHQLPVKWARTVPSVVLSKLLAVLSASAGSYTLIGKRVQTPNQANVRLSADEDALVGLVPAIHGAGRQAG